VSDLDEATRQDVEQEAPGELLSPHGRGVTAGDDVAVLARLMPGGRSSYSASDVIAYLLDRPAV
jgi:hypothetical protein